jgi:hypothetical protein
MADLLSYDGSKLPLEEARRDAKRQQAAALQNRPPVSSEKDMGHDQLPRGREGG